MTGVQFVMESHGRHEYGVFVDTEKPSNPNDGSGINYLKLADGIYWYEEKIRAPFYRRETVEEKKE